MKFGKTKLQRLLIAISALVTASSIAVTIASCSSLSQSIKDNTIDRGDGTKFADGFELKDMVKTAINDTTNNKGISQSTAKQILYIWYCSYAFNKSETDKASSEITTFKDKWQTWYSEISTEYDTKVKQYKTDYKENWEWYFQNEVLGPGQCFGGQWAFDKNGNLISKTNQKDDYIRNSIQDKVYSEFVELIYTVSYFGLPAKESSATTAADLNYDVVNSTTSANFNNLIANGYDPEIKTLTGGNTLVDKITKEPGTWQLLDFYVDVDRGTTSVEKNALGWIYAYIQHVAFEKIYDSNHPVSTVMSLWKNTSAESIVGGWKKIYNENLIPTDSQKTGWEFPWFEDVASAGPQHGPNEYFQNFVNDGFGNSNSWSTTTIPFKATNDTSNAGLIEIPINQANKYTEDSATLFKVNLTSDMFSNTFIPYAATVADFVLDIVDSSYATNLPHTASGIFPVNPVGTTNPIYKNILFTSNSLLTGGTGKTSIALDTDLLLGNAATGSSIFNPTSEWATNNYKYTTSGYRLGDGTKPYAFIKERGSDDGSGSGMHFIALDGYEYLVDTSTAINNINTTTGFWKREKDLIKYRTYQSMYPPNGGSKTGGTYDVVSSLKEFTNNNLDQIVLEIANADPTLHPYLSNNTAGPNGTNLKIFDLQEYATKYSFYDSTNFSVLFDLVNAIFKYNTFLSVQGAIGDTSDKLYSFNSKATEKAVWKSGGLVSGNYLVDDLGIYLNGIGGFLPFSTGSAWPTAFYAKEVFDVQKISMYRYEQYFGSYATSSTIQTFDAQILLDDCYTYFDSWWSQFGISGNTQSTKNIGTNKYSEYLFSTNREANAILKNLSNSDNISHPIISKYYQNYLTASNTANFLPDVAKPLIDGTSSGNNITFNNAPANFLSELFKALQQKHYSSAITTSKSIQYPALTFSSISSYLTACYDIWKQNNMLGMNNTNSLSYVNYLKTLSSLKYLLTDENDFNPYEFIKWLQRKITFGDRAIFAWTAQDYLGYDNSFSTTAPSTLTNYFKFYANYNNTNDQRYISNSTTSPAASDTTHRPFSYFYNTSSTASGDDLNGYMGLLVNSSSEAPLNNYFSNYKDHYSNSLTTYEGALYNYHQLSKNNNYLDFYSGQYDPTDLEMYYSLYGAIANCQYDLSALKKLSAELNSAIPDFGTINEKIQSDISLMDFDSNGTPLTDTRLTAATQAQGLIDALHNNTTTHNIPGSTGEHMTLNSNYVYKSATNTNGSELIPYFTTSTPSGTPNLVSNNTSTLADKYIFKTDDNYYRYAYLQISYIDLLPTTLGELSKSNAEGIFNNLVNKFGPNLIYQLLIDASGDSTVNSYVEAKVINNDNKIDKVYDRHLNDILGRKWIKNYKEKN